MGRRLLAALLAVGMVIFAGQTAAGAVNTGSITVDWGESSGSVTLFKVGIPVSGGYVLGQEFGGGVITRKDVTSYALAQWLCEHVEYEGWSLPADDNRAAEFKGLEQGLYLVVQNGPAEGYYPFVPFLVELPWEGQWNVLARPKLQRCSTEVPLTGQGSGVYVSFFGMILSGSTLVFLLKKRKYR